MGALSSNPGARAWPVFALGAMAGVVGTLLVLPAGRRVMPPAASPVAQSVVAAKSAPAPVQAEKKENAASLPAGNFPSAPSTDTDFAKIAALADPQIRHQRLGEWIAGWVEHDPNAAAAFALHVDAPDTRKEAILALVQAWAGRDANAALSWIADAAFANDYEREVAAAMACNRVAEDDPRRALRLAIDYGFADSDDGLIDGLARKWAKTDPLDAQKWVATISAGAPRDELVAGMASVWAGADPAQAARFVVEQIPPGDRQADALAKVARAWGDQNIEAARSWADSLPSGPGRKRALDELAALASPP